MYACGTTSTQVQVHQEVDSDKIIVDSITTDYRMFRPHYSSSDVYCKYIKF